MTSFAPQHWIVAPGRPLRGSLRVPGDKSVSHRAVMLGALAEGTTRITGFLEGEDTRATARVFQRLGVRIEAPGPSERVVHGVGLHGLRGTAEPLDCGNAGTGMRLLAGLLAAQAFDSTLVGDASLSKRPMRRVIEPLTQMGARIDAADGGLPPLRIRGGRRLRGIEYALPVASAQVKSALLLAGLYAEGETVVREPHPTRDYTERMLAAFGWPIAFAPGQARLSGGHRLRATEVAVPADFSSAAFFLVAASVVPGSELRLEAVGMNPRRTGLLTALRRMGADIREENAGEQGGEPVADLVVRHAPLHGAEIGGELVPDMIDEFPALFAAAACAEGRTVVRDAAELRVKESDRIAAMAAGLRALGAGIEEHPDGATIVGGPLRGGRADSRGDHRIAMSLAVAAQRAAGEVRIDDVANVATSFPGFDALAREAGFCLHPGE
ncbi:3-phosphoshikimate 1-carboxyvinyltransferase [Vulcaniibacterium tengchongense]|uniref:3-phosphoshikimate 1-carboxyvinyltransferase n=1 Tax=Vulcaniibacterium tengchongense TaxID=1273429 RepID=A0A3N4VXA0_9GAMM|nr:3-phosphoshikimate 1-carboxyvinyltransferase [Vulcaniibacterium tengchongense]RPE81747.1 3-phosphoshikimate 1-carboxyvinyltransferase [Vulcaniibacterium tengchongense]